ncbi:MAG: Ig-like domain-containing protein, partial [Pseudomonadota bacterium]
YTPNAGFIGSESFSYTIEDAFGAQAQANVSIMVIDPNEAPLASDDAAVTDQNQSVTIDVLANDSDPDGDVLTVASFTQPANGSVMQDGDALIYTPNEGFFGADSFSYVVSDGQGGEAMAQVNVTVNERDPADNQAPVANPDAASGFASELITVDVLANDFDPDGDPITVIGIDQITAAPTDITINGDGTISFRISATCSGRNLYRYTIADPFGLTSSALIEVNRISSITDEAGVATDSDLNCIL